MECDGCCHVPEMSGNLHACSSLGKKMPTEVEFREQIEPTVLVSSSPATANANVRIKSKT